MFRGLGAWSDHKSTPVIPCTDSAKLSSAYKYFIKSFTGNIDICKTV